MSDERDRWWYYAPRSMFVRGIFPIVDESVSEELFEDLLAKDSNPPGPEWLERLRRLARHLAAIRRHESERRMA